jgi:chromosome segregation ATPase
MDLLGSREHIVKQQQHIAHIEQVAGEKGAEIERLNEELARLNKEVDSTNEQKANLEELTASRSMEVDRLVGEVTRLDEEATTLKTHIVHLEQVAGEGRAEIERLNGEVSRLNVEATAKASHHEHLEQVAGERSVEIERLNGEVSRLNVEATAKASHHEHLEQVAGERSVEVERLITKLSDKSETLDRYIQESAQMARMIIEAQDDRNAWRRMSVTAEIEEVILGSRHEVGEHQHLNYTLRGIKHLGRKFNQLDVRIVDHRGNPGILIFEPNPEERAFYGWTKTGEENGRKFMLVIPSDKWGKDFLIRCTTNDILLVKDITANINKELLKKQSLSNKKWEIMCSEILKSICINGMKLHYDDVVVLDNKKNKHEIKIINPLIDFKIIEYNNIVITKNQITSISNNTTKIEYNKNKLNSETKKVFEHYNKENKNFLYHISKNINNF